jgi:hypothetical protein
MTAMSAACASGVDCQIWEASESWIATARHGLKGILDGPAPAPGSISKPGRHTTR